MRSGSDMTNRDVVSSPQTYARVAGLAFSVLAVSVVGEISLCLWLLVMGVNLAKWNEKARLAVGAVRSGGSE